MSRALSIFEGRFGRVALLDMDRSLTTHAHRACHVLLKFGGADTFFDVSGRRCPLTGDNAILVNAWEPHAYTHLENAPQTFILALYIDPDWLASLDRQLIFSGHARFFPKPSTPLPPKLATRIIEMGARMLTPEQESKAGAEGAVFDLMIAIISGSSDLKSLRSNAAATPAGDYRIRRAIAQMRERPYARLDVRALAKIAGLSRPHFFAQFKRTTGLSPALFLNTLRMESAYRMLRKPECMIGDIGQELGFDAQSNFARFFREHQGVSPREYRRATQLFY